MTCILTQTPAGLAPERAYAVGVVLGDFLGLPWRHEVADGTDVRLSLPGSPGVIVLPDTFFQIAHDKWLDPASLPAAPLKTWDVRDSGLEPTLTSPVLPIVYGDGVCRVDTATSQIRLPIDVFGTAFALLSRYEECVTPDRDEHDRFPAEASVAFQQGFLERPIVDEYGEALWAAITHLWPGLARPPARYATRITHDVDRPYGARGVSLPGLARHVARDLLRHRTIGLAARRVGARFRRGPDSHRHDPNWTFDWLMDQSEARGHVSSFYFMTAKTSPHDPGYDVLAPPMVQLLRRIADRGHEIGLHPSYGTLLRPDRLAAERTMLERALEQAGVAVPAIGGRQHYLRWRADESWLNWEQAGLSYDSTLGYAQRVGFRSGTCRPHRVWSLRERRDVRLTERPLIAMDETLLAERYMGCSLEDALSTIKRMCAACRLFAGDFVLLWHNDSHPTPDRERFYLDVLDAVGG